MNFQTVRQANGGKVVINAIAMRIDGTTFISSGTAKQDCVFTDIAGEQQAVTIWQGKGTGIPVEQQGQTLSINISSKTDRGRTYYGGFWQSGAQTQQQGSQQGQQAPQQAAGGQKSVSGGISQADVRHGLVCSAVQSRQIEIRANQIIEDLLYWQEFIITGKAPLPAGQRPQSLDYSGRQQPEGGQIPQQEEGDQIPF